MYIQRYLPHLPAAGEIVIFDRSWYNRAGVERVMGFCTEEEAEGFLKVAAAVFEKLIVESGIIPAQVLAGSIAERSRRAGSRRASGTDARSGSCPPMDLKSYNRWYDYSRARDAMFTASRHRLGALVRRAIP